MDKLIFFIAVKQKLENTIVQIIYINDLCKKLSLAYNLILIT